MTGMIAMTGTRGTKGTARLRSFATVSASIALAILAITAVSARQSAEPFKKSVEAAESSRRQPFSVVLLLGDMQGGESLEGVPAAARKALADTKDFLPYKNYRLLDSQWTLCCSGTTSAITRIRGLDDQHYELELRASPIFDSKSPVTLEPGALSVRFFLRELEPQSAISTKSDSKNTAALETRLGQINAELFSLEREQASLSSQVTSLRKGVEVGTKDPADLKRADEQLTLVNRRIAILKSELTSMTSTKTYGGSKAVMDTSFRIEVGETVVVGTSGLKGGSKALIALLTAVGKRPKS
jgi:hypothetical protein